jgi:hypothetical protein
MKDRLKSLYQNGLVHLDGILNAIVKSWISVEDALEIVGGEAEGTLGILRGVKLREASKACEAAISAGIDIELGGESLHFSLTSNDQINLTNAVGAIAAGAPAFPYHNDGGLCRLFSGDEINAIGAAATQFVMYHTTYCNHLNCYIRRIEDIDELKAIFYGMDLPEDLADNMQNILEQAQGLA